MVKLKDFDNEIFEMTNFYLGLPEKVASASDKYYAILGNKSSERILDLLEKCHFNPKNTYLKQLHANLMTLTRGVEKFNDEAIEIRHVAYGSLRNKLFDFLEKEIKW
ncbi:MAG: hypothetical protein ABIR06_04670 [Cyclobacteriaceae bacterium]